MANTHVLARSGSNITVVLHIAVPDTNNAVGTNWRVAVVNSGFFGRPPASILPTGTGPGQITAAELTSIANGSLVELVTTYTPNAAEITAPNAYLDAMYTLRSTQYLTQLQDQLNVFGYTR